jgi:hypothetical protein
MNLLILLVQVSITPNAEGIPGQGALQKLLNVAAWGGLGVCGISAVVGAAPLGIGHLTNNFFAGNAGRRIIGGALAGAGLIGVTGGLINWFPRWGG